MTPALGEDSVETVSVFFSEPVDPRTVTPESILLFAPGPDGAIETGDDIVIEPASLRYDESIRAVLTGFPTALDDGRYRGLVRASIADLAGNSLAEDFTWSFRVGGANVFWTSPNSGDWAEGRNWNTGAEPGSTDDVLVEVDEEVTVTVPDGVTADVLSIELHEALDLRGALRVAGALSGPGRLLLRGSLLPGTLDPALTLELRGGRLVGTTVPPGLEVPGGPATFEDVVFSSSLDLGQSQRLRIAGGFVLDGRVGLSGTGAELDFGPEESLLDGAGVVVLNGGQLGGQQVRIGPGMTVRGRGELRVRTLINDGEMKSDVGQTLLVASDRFENRATVSATARVVSILSSSWTNTGRFEVSGDGILVLAGTFSLDDVGTIDRDGGEVRVEGTIVNEGRSFAVPAGTGPWVFGADSRIAGGRVDPTDIRVAGATFENVTLASDLDLRRSGASPGFAVRGDLGFEGTRLTISQRQGQGVVVRSVTAGGEARLLGDGEIVFVRASSSGGNVLRGFDSLRIGPGVTVRGSDTLAQVLCSLDLTVEGTIRFDGSSSLILKGAGSLVNGGRIILSGATTADINNDNTAPPRWTNRGLLRIERGGRVRSGDYVQEAGGGLEIVVQSADRFGRLEGAAGKTFSLGGTLVVEFETGFDPPVGAS